VLRPPATRLVQTSNPYCTSILKKRSSSSYGQILQSRYFSHSPSWKKKKDKGKTGTETNAVSATSKAPEDPSDLSHLEAGIADALSQFKNDLSKLRAGGRFNPESIENLRVAIAKDRNETVRLGDVAQVVPKGGRTLTLLVNDEDVSNKTLSKAPSMPIHSTCPNALLVLWVVHRSSFAQESKLPSSTTSLILTC
jgi:hypothetical protein